MINLSTHSKALLIVLTLSSVATTGAAAQALTLKVEVENLGPMGGVDLTPVWVGFHDGSFDSYNGGLPSERGLEQIAEDGNPMLISQDFLNNLTYVQGGVSGIFSTTQVGTRVDGAIGGSPIAPGTSAMTMFEVTPDDANRYFSYASMILPSNDYYVANGNPLAHSLTTLFTGEETSISFEIGLPGTVDDAGTEVNDFATSAGNGRFGIPGGQTEGNQGANENGVNTTVTAPFANFLNRPANFDTDFANLNFNNETLYPNGIARITISAVPEPPEQEIETTPEPGTLLGLVSLLGLASFTVRKKKH